MVFAEISTIKIEAILTRKLEGKGVDSRVVPLLMRALSSSFFLNPSQNLFQANKRLRYLGWDDIELDYHIFTLAKECLLDKPRHPFGKPSKFR